MFYRDFDPNKAFFALPIVWWSAGVIALCAVVMTAFIIFSSELQLQVGYEGLNNLISIFKTPLGTLALLIPVVAVLAANHRSEQSKAQIALINEQNVFSNYYTHVDEFTKHISSHVEISSFSVLRKRGLHKLLFPHAHKGCFIVDGGVTKALTERFEVIMKGIIAFSDGHEKDAKFSIVKVLQNLEKVEADLLLSWSVTNGRAFDLGGRQVALPQSFRGGFHDIAVRSSKIMEVLEFDHHWVPPYALIEVANMNLEVVPAFMINENKDLTCEPFDVFS